MLQAIFGAPDDTLFELLSFSDYRKTHTFKDDMSGYVDFTFEDGHADPPKGNFDKIADFKDQLKDTAITNNLAKNGILMVCGINTGNISVCAPKLYLINTSRLKS